MKKDHVFIASTFEFSERFPTIHKIEKKVKNKINTVAIDGSR